MKSLSLEKIIGSLIVVFVIFGIIFAYYAPETQAKILDDSQATEEGVEKLVKGNNKFALDLYENLASDSDKNVFFSPWSISAALSMTYEGARGETADQMASILHLPGNDTVRRSSFARIHNLLNVNREYKLKEANALWTHKDYEFLESYLNVNKDYYGAKVENLDFVNNKGEAVDTINQWVKEKTEGKIEKLIKESMVNSMTRMVLTNAIYFKGAWQIQFDEEKTTQEEFKVSSDKKVKVQMMQLTGEKAEFNFTENKNLKALELPYKGKDLSMILFLPKKDFGLSDLEEEFSVQKLSQIESEMNKEEVDVYLPRFEFKTKYPLKEKLQRMGMKLPFNPKKADFSGMDGTNKLFIQFVRHKAYVKVNEEGTEAAAATGVVVGATSAGPMTVFRADHPFLFMIKDRRTGSILFMGRMSNPKE